MSISSDFLFLQWQNTGPNTSQKNRCWPVQTTAQRDKWLLRTISTRTWEHRLTMRYDQQCNLRRWPALTGDGFIAGARTEQIAAIVLNVKTKNPDLLTPRSTLTAKAYVIHSIRKQFSTLLGRVQKNPGFFLKKAQPSGFGGFWVLLGFLDKQEKIGKTIQKLSNLKP